MNNFILLIKMKTFGIINIFTVINFFLTTNHISSHNLVFPSAITLTNGNILIIESLGIYISDSTFTNIELKYNLDEEDQIKTEDDLSRVILKRSRGYVICLINYKIYFFSGTGVLLKKSNKFYDQELDYYTLIPCYVSNNIYYFVIGFFDSNTHLNLKYYKYNTNLNSFSYIDTKKEEQYKNSYNFASNSLSCEYIYDYYYGNNYDGFITCFFVIDKDGSQCLIEGFYSLTTASISNSNSIQNILESVQNVKVIKSESNYDLSEALVCWIEENNESNCIVFIIYKYQGMFIDEQGYNLKCKDKFYGLKVSYIFENRNIVFSCILLNGGIQADIYNENMENPSTTTDKKFQTCESIFGYSILYTDKYYVLSDTKCNGVSNTFKQLIIEDEETTQTTDVSDKKEEEEEEEEKEGEEEEEEKEKEEEEEEKEEEEEEEEEIEKIIQNENCNVLKKCLKCNEESLSKELCIECNIKEGYYPLNIPQKDIINDNYIDCVNESTKPSNFYFNQENQDYEACYESCATCDFKGDGNENNCTSCEENYIKKPEYEDSKNCVIKCLYYYYYTSYEQYKCTNLDECPEEYNLLIKDKLKCTDDCSKDNIYKYKYNGECLTKCPENTKDDNYYLCKDNNINKCLLSENKYNSLTNNFTDEEIEKLAGKYAQEFNYTDDHVSLYKNEIYTITLYKNGECISDLSLTIPEIDFGECYNKIKSTHHIEENLVIAIVDKKTEGSNYHKMISYSMFDPKYGKKLPADELCKDEKVVVQENLMSKLNDTNLDINSLLHLTDQNINIFNLSSDFYTDICYHYESNLDKDVALQDRIL